MAWLTAVVFAGLFFDWAAIALGWYKIKPFSKTAATLLVILWTAFAASWQVDGVISLLLLALGMGLAGDIFLLFPERWFLWGLVAFLIGHVFYISLFLSILSTILNGVSIAVMLQWVALCVLIEVVFLIIFYHFFKSTFLKRSSSQLLWKSVQVYAWILSAMTVLTYLVFMLKPTSIWQWAFLPLGGTLFLISDLMLASDRFIKKIPSGQLWVRITYHLAQFSLAYGCLAILL